MTVPSEANSGWAGVIQTYRKYMPLKPETEAVTLLEGNTPLIPLPGVSKRLDGLKIFAKFEGMNPTGSFKDRGMCMAITNAVEEGHEAVICASTGNTSAAAATYASRAGLVCTVVLPKGAIALGKLSQAFMHGAKVIAIEGNFDDALRIVREIAADFPVQVVNSINPYRIEGQKSGSFEICDVLGTPPDYQAMPVGNAGNITAYWKGYCEYYDTGVIDTKPKMLGFQAAGAAPIVLGKPVAKPETIATAIRIGNPASWKQAEAARDESGGLIDSVTDEEILKAYHVLAREGVFCEPASASGLAGLFKKWDAGYFKDALAEGPRTVVCIVTGHGLKDPDRAISESPDPLVLSAETGAVANAMGF